MPVSDSEKLGVSVLGCHFGEKAEQVPIKKRKFMFRSPFPPPTVPFQHVEEDEKLVKSQPQAIDFEASSKDLSETVDTECNVDQNRLVKVNKHLDKNKDFSGISILAAAACGNDFRGDDHGTECSAVEQSFVLEGSMKNESYSLSKPASKEDLSSADVSTYGTGSSSSLVHTKEHAALLKIENSFLNNILKPDFAHNDSVTISEVIKDEGTDRVHGHSSRDDRSHWDLNTYMDSWERPVDHQIAGSCTTAASLSPEDFNYDNCNDKSKPGSSQCHADKNMVPADTREMAHNEQVSNMEECELDSHTDTDSVNCLPEKRSSSGCVDFVSVNVTSESTERDKSASVQCSTVSPRRKSENLFPNQVRALDSSVDALLSKISHSKGTSISEAICDAVSSDLTCVKNEECCAADTGKIMSTGSQVVEEVAPSETLSSVTMHRTQGLLNEDGEHGKEIPDLHDACNVFKNSIHVKSGYSDNVCVKPLPQSDEIGLSLSFPSVVETLASGSLTIDSNVQHDNIPVTDAGQTADGVQVEIEEFLTKSSENSPAFVQALSGFSLYDSCKNKHVDIVHVSNKIAPDETFENDDYSEVSCDDQKVSKSQVDYDSQYEDGEVRESIEHTWEEYDGEDIEAEHVDYGSDNVNLGSGAEEIMDNTKGLDSDFCPSILKGKDACNKDAVDNTDKTEAGSDKLTGDSMVGAQVDHIRDGMRSDGSRKVSSSNRMDVLVESRMHGMELRSFIERRTSHDVLFRKDRDVNVPNFRSERYSRYIEYSGKGRYAQHTHVGGRCDRSVDSQDRNRSMRRNHSTNYHGSMSYHHPRPENYVHRHLRRSGSPDARNEAFGMHKQIRQSCNLSPGRPVTLGRGRSIRYGLSVDGKDPRDRHLRPAPEDCTGASFNPLHPSTKRDGNFSPVESSDLHTSQPQFKSLSRSRSRSPYSVRRRSKSPNFRPELRLQRVKSPHQRPGLLGGRVGGFRQMPGSHVSPPYGTRRIGDKKDDMLHFREQGHNQHYSFLERSPGRFGQRGDRFHLVDSRRGFRSMYLGGFMGMDGVGRRGSFRHEGGHDDRGKHGHRHGPIHSVKRFDVDGPMRRFRYNFEDNFVAPRTSRCRDDTDFHGRGSPKYNGRDVDGQITDRLRELRGDTGTISYGREAKHEVDSKSSAVREGGDDTASRRRPP